MITNLCLQLYGCRLLNPPHSIDPSAVHTTRFRPLTKFRVIVVRKRRALLHSLEVRGTATPQAMSCTRRLNHSSHSTVQWPQLNPLLCHALFLGHHDASAVCSPLPTQPSEELALSMTRPIEQLTGINLVHAHQRVYYCIRKDPH